MHDRNAMAEAGFRPNPGGSLVQDCVEKYMSLLSMSGWKGVYTVRLSVAGRLSLLIGGAGTHRKKADRNQLHTGALATGIANLKVCFHGKKERHLSCL